MAMLWYFWAFWALVFLLSKEQDVEASQCHQSPLRRWRCAPCGQGTRCVFCQWCLCYCWNQDTQLKDRSLQTPIYGNSTVPYKKPIIELFEEIETLIKNDSISNIEVVELFEVTTLALSEDCELCYDTPEIEELRDKTRSMHAKLSEIMMSENSTSTETSRRKRSPSFISQESNTFKEVALNSTTESLLTANKIPETVLGKIDVDSTIQETLGKCSY